MENSNKQYLSIKETAEHLGLSEKNIRVKVKNEEIPSYKIGRKYLIDKWELKEYVRLHKVTKKKTKRPIERVKQRGYEDNPWNLPLH